MQVNRDKILYVLTWSFFDRTRYFSRSKVGRSHSRKMANELDETVINPELSVIGLKERVETITMMANFFHLLTVGVVICLLIPGLLIEIPSGVLKIIFSIILSLLITSIVFSIRGMIASIDVVRFKSNDKSRKNDNFKLNVYAHPKITDLIPGIIVFVAALFTIDSWF